MSYRKIILENRLFIIASKNKAVPNAPMLYNSSNEREKIMFQYLLDQATEITKQILNVKQKKNWHFVEHIKFEGIPIPIHFCNQSFLDGKLKLHIQDGNLGDKDKTISLVNLHKESSGKYNASYEYNYWAPDKFIKIVTQDDPSYLLAVIIGQYPSKYSVAPILHELIHVYMQLLGVTNARMQDLLSFIEDNGFDGDQLLFYDNESNLILPCRPMLTMLRLIDEYLVHINVLKWLLTADNIEGISEEMDIMMSFANAQMSMDNYHEKVVKPLFGDDFLALWHSFWKKWTPSEAEIEPIRKKLATYTEKWKKEALQEILSDLSDE